MGGLQFWIFGGPFHPLHEPLGGRHAYAQFKYRIGGTFLMFIAKLPPIAITNCAIDLHYRQKFNISRPKVPRIGLIY